MKYKKTIPFVLFTITLISGAALLRTDSNKKTNIAHVKDDQAIVGDAGAIDADGIPAQDAIAVPVIADSANTAQISSYTVLPGDTISGIAEKFSISANTIRWANDLTSKSKIKVGDVLTILPVTGVQYTVKKGDTISGIAKRFGADAQEIVDSNNLEDDRAIKVGMTLILPDAEPTQRKNSSKKDVTRGNTQSSKTKKTDSKKSSTNKNVPKRETQNNTTNVTQEITTKNIHTVTQSSTSRDITAVEQQDTSTSSISAIQNDVKNTSTTSMPSETTKNTQQTSSETTQDAPVQKNNSSPQDSAVQFVMPLPGGSLSQRLHGANAVDIRSPIGSTVIAAASGTVIVAKGRGAYNGGYGNYVVISHTNGVQTLYSHLHSVSVVNGQTVQQGQEIAKSGNTGKSTGPHLHFEVRGAKNPFRNDSVGTQY